MDCANAYPNIRLNNNNVSGYSGFYFHQGSTQKAFFEVPKSYVPAVGIRNPFRSRSTGALTSTEGILTLRIGHSPGAARRCNRHTSSDFAWTPI
jgi:hypothetical protein